MQTNNFSRNFEVIRYFRGNPENPNPDEAEIAKFGNSPLENPM